MGKMPFLHSWAITVKSETSEILILKIKISEFFYWIDEVMFCISYAKNLSPLILLTI